MRRERGEFLTTELASKLEKSIATRFFESRKFKVSHSLMVGCLGEEEKGEMKEYNLCFGLDLQRVCDEFMTLSFPSFYTIYFTKLAHPFS